LKLISAQSGISCWIKSPKIAKERLHLRPDFVDRIYA